MPARSPVRRKLVAQIAAGERHDPDSATLPSLRAELATERISEEIAGAPPLGDSQRARLIRQIVDAAPPLTPEQRARLRPILSGTLPADDASR
jgi:hypothetical protein